MGGCSKKKAEVREHDLCYAEEGWSSWGEEESDMKVEVEVVVEKKQVLSALGKLKVQSVL